MVLVLAGLVSVVVGDVSAPVQEAATRLRIAQPTTPRPFTPDPLLHTAARLAVEHLLMAEHPRLDLERIEDMSSAKTTPRSRESVWDYPRPPRVELDDRRVVVMSGEIELATTTIAHRVLETSHPPVFYIPAQHVGWAHLKPNRHTTFCEYKGRANYFDLKGGAQVIRNVAWTYRTPSPGFEQLRDMVAFYPGKVDCYVEGVKVEPQAGDFYGGWITPEIDGPFKGGHGTTGW